MLKFGGRNTFALFEETRQVGLRREAQTQGYVLEWLVGCGDKLGNLGSDTLVDDGLGRTTGNLTGYLCQIARTNIELFGIESHIGIAVVVMLNSIQELIVKLLATGVTIGINGRQLLEIGLRMQQSIAHLLVETEIVGQSRT